MVRERWHACCNLRQGVGATIGSDTGIPSTETRAGEIGPQRRCLVTGESSDRSLLLRFVIGPDDVVVPDIATRLPGRGWWLSARREIVERAVAKRYFSRAARRAVTAPAGLADRIEALLVQRCVDAIGLARRAGLAVCGFERVNDAVRNGKAAVLLAALDGAEGGRRKLAGLGRGLPVICALTAAEIGAVFGRDHVVNASLGSGPLGRRLIADAQKLVGFRANAAVERAAAH